MVIGVSAEGPLTPPQGGTAKDPVTTDSSCQLRCSASSIAKSSEGHGNHSASYWMIVMLPKHKPLHDNTVDISSSFPHQLLVSALGGGFWSCLKVQFLIKLLNVFIASK